MINWENIAQGIQQTSIWEWLAFVFSLLYVVFATKRSNICWFFAVIASALYIYICFSVNLYLESVLQFFYLVMAMIGWVQWKATINQKRDLQTWTIATHVMLVLGSLLVALLLGKLTDSYSNQANPYTDAFTTIFSFVATFMVVKKVVENWVYWILIDAVSVYLYYDRGLQLSALLFVIFTVIAFVGFYTWRKEYIKQKAQ